VFIPTLHPFLQLPTEKAWVRGELPGSFLTSHGNRRSARLRIDIAKKIEKVLDSCELMPVLRVLEKHNNQQNSKKGCGRRKSPFLLGPYLFHVMNSVELQKVIRETTPLLAQSPAKVRVHFKGASAKTKALARLVRKGPRPLIALAARVRKVIEPFPIIRSPNRSATAVPLDWLLDNVAISLESIAEKTLQRQHRKLAQSARMAEQLELRRLAISVLCDAFRKEFNQPYHSHVATIVTELIGIDTDADYVKKVHKRARRSTRRSRGQNS